MTVVRTQLEVDIYKYESNIPMNAIIRKEARSLCKYDTFIINDHEQNIIVDNKNILLNMTITY